MKKTAFNQKWKFCKAGESLKDVELPHDAMMCEKRGKDAAGGVSSAWFYGGDYEYRKSFLALPEWKGADVVFEFEGVYRNAEVFINGEKAAERKNGFTNFYVRAENLKYGERNEISVTAKNSDQPNCRWYSGAGIYRPVWLYVLPKKHIELNGVKIRTLSYEPAEIEVKINTNADGGIALSAGYGGSVAAQTEGVQTGGEGVYRLTIPDARLWSADEPNLYTLRVKFFDDEREIKFGVRKVEVGPRGLFVNGKREILRGACIHSDNGILGARSFAEAEERKIRLLKENGYNAVRSAHNPCAKSLLDACDKLGMYVLDEYADSWYIKKNKYDFARVLEGEYGRDIADMVEKDINHPSVIAYSLGNEVAETGEERGIELMKKMKALCKKIDPDRPVTVGINPFFNYLYALGFGQYSDKKADKNPEKKAGSEFFNDIAGKTGAGFMKGMAKLGGVDKKIKKAYAALDIAGYNYGIKRYEGDIKKYPDRVILGTETFCSDAYEFWELAKKHPAIIGDFVWAGMDYLGEVGIGSWEYRDYAESFNHGPGWISAGSGRLDLTGKPLGEALYTKVAFGLESAPQIAVVPVNHTKDKHSPSAWKFSNAIPSWSWNGLNGNTAKIEVYSRAPEVALYINGKKAGQKKFKKNCRYEFEAKYYDGEITAVNLDNRGKEVCRSTLKTAKNETVLSVKCEETEIKRGGLCFVRIAFTDPDGVVKPLERGIIRVGVSGGELLALGNGCPYNPDGYSGRETKTYYGEALAAIKVTSPEAEVFAECGSISGKTKIIAGN